VFAVLCRAALPKQGTGFLHKSGRVITAGHVVSGCSGPDTLLAGDDKVKAGVSTIIRDEMMDLALLTPDAQLHGRTLEIAKPRPTNPGMQVSTWGFPAGIRGTALVTVGHISGTTWVDVPGRPDLVIHRLVLNAALNHGNSGGPILDLTDGAVIGVALAMLAVEPPWVREGISLLEKQLTGLAKHTLRFDGAPETVTDIVLLARILSQIRSQAQLSIGLSVRPNDLRDFLTKHGIDP